MLLRIKSQEISNVLLTPKMQTKIFQGFLPNPLKWVKIKCPLSYKLGFFVFDIEILRFPDL